MSTEGRTEKAGKNFLYGIFNKLIFLILTFFSRRIFIHYIGVQYLGINGLFGNILSLLTMADLGLGVAMSFTFYEPLANHNQEKIAGLVNFYRKIYNIIALSVAVIGAALTPFLKYLVNMETDIPYLHVYYLMFVANIVISYLFVYKSTIISADQKSYIISTYNLILNVLKIILQIVFMIVLKNYFIYLMMEIMYTLFNNLVISYKADKLYPYIKRGNGTILEKREKKKIFNNIKSVFIYKISNVLLNGVDNIVLSVVVGTIYVGFYANYQTITTNINAFVTIIFNAVTAGVGNMVVTENKENRYKVFKVMQMVSFWLSGIIAVCMLFVIQDFIVMWVGTSFLLDDITVIAIVLNLYFFTTMNPIWTFREATGLYQKTKYVMLVAAGVNLILSIIMAHQLGVSGVIFATVISRIVTYFWYEPRLLFQLFFEKNVFTYYMEYIINILINVGAVLLLYFIFSQMSMPQNRIYSFILKGIVSFIIINLLMLIRYIKTDEFKYGIEKVKCLFKGKA